MKKLRDNAAMLFFLPSNFFPVFIKLGILAVCLFLLTTVVDTSQCEAEISSQKIAQLRTDNNTILRDVLDDIFKQTGYRIVVSEELSSVPVPGVYKDVSVEEFLKRVLKKYNVSVIYDEKDQVAYVRSFGESLGQNQKGAYVAVPKDELLQETDEDSNAIDPLSGLPLDELQRLQVQQLEEMERQKNDPDTIDPESGLPLAELERLKVEQLEEMERQKNDPDAIDPQSGLPVVELERLKTQQLEELERQKNDPDAIDPLSGIPLAELHEARDRQLEELTRQENDPNAIDPLENIPLSDLPQ